MKSIQTKHVAALAALGCLLTASCSDDEAVVVADGFDVEDEAAWADACAALNYALVDPIGDELMFSSDVAEQPAPIADTMAARVAASARSYFAPASCVSATSAGATATITLNDCDGPLGIRDVSGTFTATYVSTDAGFSAQLRTQNIDIGGRTGQWNIDSAASQVAGTRTLSVASSGTLTGFFGNTFERNAQATVRFTPGSGCVAVDSEGGIVWNSVAYGTQLAGYQRCTGQCPSAGTLFLDGPSEDVTVSFDGSSSPPAVSTAGGSADLDLDCD